MTERNEAGRRSLSTLVVILAVLFGVTGQMAVGGSPAWADPFQAPAPAPLPPLAPGPTHSSGTPQLCSAPAAQTSRLQQKIAELRGRIDAHNAAGGGVNTYDKSQVDMYNARASQLNTEKDALNTEISAAKARMATCRATATKLESYGQPMVELSPQVRRRLEELQKGLPKDWKGFQPREMPRRKNGDVEVHPIAQPFLDVFRERTPTYPYPNIRLQGKLKPAPNDINPATGPPYGTTRAKGRNSGHAAVTPDHIVPITELAMMPGFLWLTADQQSWLMNTPMNFAWLGFGTNRRKGSRDVARMAILDPDWNREYDRLQQEKRQMLQEMIDRFTEINRTN